MTSKKSSNPCKMNPINIKRLYHPAYNVLCTGNTYIWVNPRYEDNVQMVRDMEYKRNKRMHIFIGDVALVDYSFKMFITEFFYNPFESPVLTIHIPGSMPDLKVVIQDMVDHLELAPNESHKPRIRIICEHKPVRFKIEGWSAAPMHEPAALVVECTSDRLQIHVDVISSEIGGYYYKFRPFGGTPGAVKNRVQAEWPNLFKDQLIASFKETCPPGIQKAFNTDAEIWDYILQIGEWDTKHQ